MSLSKTTNETDLIFLKPRSQNLYIYTTNTFLLEITKSCLFQKIG